MQQTDVRSSLEHFSSTPVKSLPCKREDTPPASLSSLPLTSLANLPNNTISTPLAIASASKLLTTDNKSLLRSVWWTTYDEIRVFSNWRRNRAALLISYSLKIWYKEEKYIFLETSAMKNIDLSLTSYFNCERNLPLRCLAWLRFTFRLNYRNRLLLSALRSPSSNRPSSR